jgi:hypothetical protein
VGEPSVWQHRFICVEVKNASQFLCVRGLSKHRKNTYVPCLFNTVGGKSRGLRPAYCTQHDGQIFIYTLYGSIVPSKPKSPNC